MLWFLFIFLSCFEISHEPLAAVNNIVVYETFVLGPPVQKAQWAETPRVRVCASAEIGIHRVNSALKYWEMLGYDFEGVRIDADLRCGAPHHGEIIITLPTGTINSKHIASTRIFTEKISGHIAKAQVFIYPHQGRRQRVLEHERGHALGWTHHSAKFHIMHPNWFEGGYNHTGLRKKHD